MTRTTTGLRRVLGAAVLLAATGAQAVPSDFSFRGTFASDDEVQLFNFSANGSSNVTLRSYSYGGGTQADGTVIGRGGFDPILALFDAAGTLVRQQDDDPDDNSVCDGGNTDPVTGSCFDVFFTELLAAGAYTVAIMQYDSFPGGSLADGFDRDGQGNFTSAFGCSNGSFCDVNGDNRSNAWAFDILGVEQAADASSVPAPAGAALSLVAFGLLIRRRLTF